MGKRKSAISSGFVCNQKLQEMPEISDGHYHCSQCEKTVIDVVNMSKEALHATLVANDGNICARYRSSQLGELEFQDSGTSLTHLALKRAAVISIPAFLTLGAAQQAKAQLPQQEIPAREISAREIPAREDTCRNRCLPKVSIEELRQLEQFDVLGKVTLKGVATDPDTLHEEEASINRITGKILDAETGETLIGATVMIKGTTRGTCTDYDGFFELSLDGQHLEEIILEVRYVSYFSKEVIVKNVSSAEESIVRLEPIVLSQDLEAYVGYLRVYDRPPPFRKRA